MFPLDYKNSPCFLVDITLKGHQDSLKHHDLNLFYE